MIKFRLIKDNKIVGYEKHELDKDGDMGIFFSRNGENWRCISDFWISHTSKDQFIKLDKFGKEIYEGDTVEVITMVYGETVLCEKVFLTKKLLTGFFIFEYNSDNLKLMCDPYEHNSDNSKLICDPYDKEAK